MVQGSSVLQKGVPVVTFHFPGTTGSQTAAETRQKSKQKCFSYHLEMGIKSHPCVVAVTFAEDVCGVDGLGKRVLPPSLGGKELLFPKAQGKQQQPRQVPSNTHKVCTSKGNVTFT